MQPSRDRPPLYLLTYPIYYGLYPILALWAANVEQAPPFAVLRSLLFALGLLAVTWGACRLLFRDAGKAALAASLALLLFYSFGHVYDLLGGPGALQYRTLVAAWGLFLAAGWFGIARARRVPGQVHVVPLAVGLCLVLFSGVRVLLSLPDIARPASPGQAGFIAETAAPAGSPDVYYILVDNYSRADVLQALGYDNSAFLQSLTDLGFDVDPCAQSNYAYTHTSMASALNMDYIDALGVPIDPALETERIEDFAPLIQDSRVLRQFRDLGYRFVSFRGVYPWLNIPGSDVYYDPEVSTGLLNRQEAVNFQHLFFRTTLLRPLMDALDSAGSRLESLPSPALSLLNYLNPKSSLFLTRQYTDYRNNLFAFEKLAEIPHLPGKKFVYAHLYSAHVPFVFNADGSLRAGGAEDAQSYLESLRYTNTRLLEIVQAILRDSPEPPVIILQSDHGFPTTPERVRILNALYLPGAPGLHPDGLTPVNTFRLVFSHYFGLDYPLLPDRSYATPPGRPYVFDPVPPSCAGE